MKNIITVLVVVVVAAIGYYAYTNYMPAPTAEGPGDTAAEGKLDINAICDGALAYMTFPDGASAEKFVAECKEGKHPEVIEKYKADMNLGEGAAI